MQIGDRVSVNGHTGVVVALLADKAFASGYSSDEWGYLATGILVEDDRAGLIHYPDLSDVRVEQP